MIAAGLDLSMGRRWVVRPEVRVRAVDPWAGTIADLAVGVGWRIAR